MSRILLLVLLIGVGLAPCLSQAKVLEFRAVGPFSVRSQNPLYLQLLAMPMESPHTLRRNEAKTTLHTTFSNIFEYNPTGDTLYTLDMELWRTAITLAYGLTHNLDVQLEVPIMGNGGGFLDSAIQGYHDLFGFPNGGREQVANGSFDFTLSDAGTTLINHPQSPFGLGDMVLRFKLNTHKYFTLPFGFELALAPYLKIPVGEVSKGFSSGRFDFGLSAFFQKDWGRWHWFQQVGLVALGGSETMGPFLKPILFSAGESLEFQLSNRLSALVQLTGNSSAFKNTDAADLTRIVMDLTLGLAGDIPIQSKEIDAFFYQLAFSEDILSSGPSVDFSILFLAGLRY